MTATQGAYTLTFDYLPWGRHFDPTLRTAGNGVITCRRSTHPRRPSNVGGGASLGTQYVEVHAWWEDHASITDVDAFHRSVVAAIEAIVRANEKAFTDSYYVFVDNHVDLGDLMDDTIRNHAQVLVSARTSEVY
jgi:hypothetical protein